VGGIGKRVGSEVQNYSTTFTTCKSWGRLIATIKATAVSSGTITPRCAGAPEIDDSQEIFYPAVVKAIIETGFQGFCRQEFVPKRDDKKSHLLKQAVGIATFRTAQASVSSGKRDKNRGFHD